MESLPEWFIKLFTRQGDVVLDPFMGSGTAIVVAQRMNRKALGIDFLPEYYKITTERLDEVMQWTLLEPDKHCEIINHRPTGLVSEGGSKGRLLFCFCAQAARAPSPPAGQ
jgi:hypothetical protein